MFHGTYLMRLFLIQFNTFLLYTSLRKSNEDTRMFESNKYITKLSSIMDEELLNRLKNFSATDKNENEEDE